MLVILSGIVMFDNEPQYANSPSPILVTLLGIVILFKEIDKKKIQMTDAIKTIGTHEVTVKLHPKVTAKLRVQVQGQ